METRAHLLSQYGPLLTYRQLAGLLDRTVGGLKASLSRPSTEDARSLREARVRVGGRAYFRTHQVAELLERGEDSSEGNMK